MIQILIDELCMVGGIGLLALVMAYAQFRRSMRKMRH